MFRITNGLILVQGDKLSRVKIVKQKTRITVRQNEVKGPGQGLGFC